MDQPKVLITGAGGFVGHHLTGFLKNSGYWVRAADIKYPEYSTTAADEFLILDLRKLENCIQATEGIETVYALAADMGGMGYISSNHARIFRNNLLIDLQTLEGARVSGSQQVLFTSSACVYPEFLQVKTDVRPLKEEDAYPAQPQDAYGWEKLVGERLCTHYREECNLDTRIVRLHNIFGPLCTWYGGREKAPAAICRKIAMAKLTGNLEIEIWGDGEQTRSFCYVDDCVVGLHKLMCASYTAPLNLGQERLVTINQLVDMVAQIANVKILKKYVCGPQGVRGRNSDNTRLRQVLNWEPEISLECGLAQTYAWIEEQVLASQTLH